jgi:uncharacterized membrane-anchored protein YhcB (DUF1043 family)
MSKRKYTKIQEMETEIMSMREAGQTLREIAEHFGLEVKQLKNLVNRHNRRQRKMEAGIMPRLKGRPRKDAPARDVVVEQAYEINRLKMENKLLRDFLRLTGRK